MQQLITTIKRSLRHFGALSWIAGLATLSLSSCEEVIDLELEETRPRLAIDALIRIPENAQQTLASVKAMTTASYFDQPEPATLEAISLINETTDEQISLLASNEQEGLYQQIIPVQFFLDGSVTLRIQYQNNIYEARYTLQSGAGLQSLEQGTGTLFDPEDTEVIIGFNDPGDQDNYYLFDLDFQEYLTSIDTFYQGQFFQFSYFYEDLEPGDQIAVSLMPIDRNFYNYMNQIIDQSGQDGFTPFAVPPGNLRGNIRQVFPEVKMEEAPVLGYFAVAYSSTLQLEIQ